MKRSVRGAKECLAKALPDGVTPERVRRTLAHCPLRSPKDREAFGCELLATLLQVCEGEERRD